MDEADLREAFDVLADETRIATLRALVRADGPLQFSELRERAGVRDSGRFAYHLRRLLDRFVEKRDGGYQLTEAARERLSAASDDPGFEVRLTTW